MKNFTMFLVGVLALGGCTGSGHSDGDSRPTVTVSIAPQAWLLEQIAGDSVVVNTLLSTGANPETFEPGVTVMKTASGSDALMLSGALGFEATLAERIGANNPELKIVDTSRGIEPIYGTHSHAGHVHSDDVADPHTWTSVRNARTIAANMLSTLVEIDPDNAEYYRLRAARLDSRLDSLDRAIAARLDSLSSRTFLVWHPSLSYFARDYGLQQVSIGNEGRETTVQGLRSIIDRASDAGPQVLFVQADFDSSRAEALSAETGARVEMINPLDPDWESQINIIVNALDQR